MPDRKARSRQPQGAEPAAARRGAGSRKARSRQPHSPKPQFQPQPARTGAQRGVDTQEVKELFLLVCEGEKTEPNYFLSF